MAVFGRRDDLAGGGSRLKALLIPLYLLASAVGLLLPPRPSYSFWGTNPKFPEPLDRFYLQYRCMVSGVQPGDQFRVQRATGTDWITLDCGDPVWGADWIRAQGIAAPVPNGQPHLLTAKVKFCACICGCYWYHLWCGTTEVVPGLWTDYFVTRAWCLGFVPDC